MKNKHIPIYIKIAIIISLIGFSYPIYGFPIQNIKLTFSRIALIMLFPILLVFRKRVNNIASFKILTLFTIFVLSRCITLLYTDNFTYGITQIIWFSEGLIFLVLIAIISSNYSSFYKFYIKSVFIIGFSSALVLLLQSVLMYIFKYPFKLPYSDSYYGISQEQLAILPNYPIYGVGRIVGSFWEPNMSGSLCAFFFATFLPFLSTKKNVLNINSMILMLVLILTFISVIGTGSRQSLLCIGCIIVLHSIINGITSKAVLRWTVILFLIGSIIYLFGLDKHLSLIFSENEDNIFARFQNGIKSNNISGGRFQWMEQIIKDVKFTDLIFGIGEGGTKGGGHNAFLAIIVENGLFVLMIFISLLYTIIKYSFEKLKYKSSNNYIYLSILYIIISWIILIFSNWAQLNQSLSFQFLAIIIIVLNDIKNLQQDNLSNIKQ